MHSVTPTDGFLSQSWLTFRRLSLAHVSLFVFAYVTVCRHAPIHIHLHTRTTPTHKRKQQPVLYKTTSCGKLKCIYKADDLLYIYIYIYTHTLELQCNVVQNNTKVDITRVLAPVCFGPWSPNLSENPFVRARCITNGH